MNPFKRFFSPRKNKLLFLFVLSSLLLLGFSWSLSDVKGEAKKDDSDQTESQESSTFSHGVDIMKKFIQENLDYLKDKKENMGEMLDEAKQYFDQKWGGVKERLKSSGFDSSIDDRDISRPEDGPMTPEELKKMNPDDLLYPEQVEIHHDDSIAGKVLDALHTMKDKLAQGFDSVGDSLHTGKDTLTEKLSKLGETFDHGKEAIKKAIPDTILPKSEPITKNNKQDIEELNQVLPEDLQRTPAGETYQEVKLPGKFSETIGNLGEKLAAAKDSIADSVSEGISKLGEKISTGTESIKGIIHDMPPIGEKLQHSKEYISEKVSNLADKVSARLGRKKTQDDSSLSEDEGKGDSITDKLREGKEFIKEKFEDLTTDKMKKIWEEEKANWVEDFEGSDDDDSDKLSMTDKIKSKLVDTKEYLRDIKDEITGELPPDHLSRLKGAKDMAKDRVDQGKEFIKDKLRDINPEKLKKIWNEKKAEWVDNVDDLGDNFDEFGDKIKEKWVEGKEYIKDKKDDLVDSVDSGLGYLKDKKDAIVDSMIPDTDKIKDKWEEGKDYVKDKLDDAKDFVKDKKDDLEDKFDDGMGYLYRKKDKLKDKLGDSYDYLKDKKEDLGDKWEEGKEIIKDKLEDAKDTLKEKKDDLGEKLIEGKEYIKDKFGDAKDILIDKKDELIDKVDSGIDYLKEKKDDLGEKWDEGKEIIKDKLVDAKDVLKEKKDDLGEKWVEGKEYIKDKIEDAKDAIFDKKDDLVDSAESGIGYLKEKKDDLGEKWIEGKEYIKDKLEDAKDILVDKKDELVDKVDSGIDYLKEKKDNLGEKWEEGKEIIKDKLGDAKDAIFDKKDDLVEKAESGFDSLDINKDELGEKWEEGKKMITDRLEEAKDYIKDKKEDLMDKADSTFDNLTDKKDKLMDAASFPTIEVIKDKLEDSKEFVKDKFEDAKDFVKGKKEDIGSHVGHHPETVKEKITPYHHYKKKDSYNEKIDQGKEHIKEKIHPKKDVLRDHSQKNIIEVPGSDHISPDNLSIKEGLDYLKEKKDDLVGALTPPGMDKIKEKFEEGKEFVKGKFEDAKDFVKEKKDDFIDSDKPATVFVIKDKLEDAKDALKEKKDDLMENISMDTLKGSVQDTIQFIKEKKDQLIGDVSLEELKDRVIKGVDRVKEKKDDLLENVSVEGVKDKISEGMEALKDKKDELVDNLNLDNLSDKIKDYLPDRDSFFGLKDLLNQKKEDLQWLFGKKDDILGRLVGHGIIKEGGKFDDVNDMISSKLDDAIKLADTDEKKRQLKDYLVNLQQGSEEVPFGASFMNRLEELGVDFSIFDEKIQTLKGLIHHQRHVKLPESELKGKEAYLENIIGHEKDPYDRKEDVLSSIIDDSDDIKMMKEEEMDPARLGKEQILERLNQHNPNQDISFWENSGDESVSFIEA